jgi:hypothetical protein
VPPDPRRLGRSLSAHCRAPLRGTRPREPPIGPVEPSAQVMKIELTGKPESRPVGVGAVCDAVVGAAPGGPVGAPAGGVTRSAAEQTAGKAVNPTPKKDVAPKPQKSSYSGPKFQAGL